MWHALGITLITLLYDACKGLVGRILVALGVGTVTAVGMGALLSAAVSQIQAQMASSSQVFPAMVAMGVPWFVGLILSAVGTRLTLRGLTSDGMSFWTMRARTPKS